MGQLLNEAGLRVVQTPLRAPNANAYAERFVRSIKEESLDRISPIGERHFRRAVSDFVAHYHRERNPGAGESADRECWTCSSRGPDPSACPAGRSVELLRTGRVTVTFINVDGWPNAPTASFRVLNTCLYLGVRADPADREEGKVR